MAGPRLTKEKRSELRKEIGEQVAAKAKLAEIVKSLAAKYGIGENAVRWHYGRVVNDKGMGQRRGGRPAQAKRGRPRKRVATVKGKHSRGPRRPPGLRSLVTALGKISPAKLRQIIKSSKLQEKHDALVARAAELRRKLKAVERKAGKIERRLRRTIEV